MVEYSFYVTLAGIPDISQPENKGNIAENRIHIWVGRREIRREGERRGREAERERREIKKFLVSLFFEPQYLNRA